MKKITDTVYIFNGFRKQEQENIKQIFEENMDGASILLDGEVDVEYYPLQTNHGFPVVISFTKKRVGLLRTIWRLLF